MCFFCGVKLHIFWAPEYVGMSGNKPLEKILEVTCMCNNSCWWIIILILLFSCCGGGNGLFGGNGCGNGCGNRCDCDNNCGCC